MIATSFKGSTRSDCRRRTKSTRTFARAPPRWRGASSRVPSSRSKSQTDDTRRVHSAGMQFTDVLVGHAVEHAAVVQAVVNLHLQEFDAISAQSRFFQNYRSYLHAKVVHVDSHQR